MDMNSQRKIIMLPVGSDAAKTHYSSSIEKTMTLDILSEYLDDDGLDQLYCGEECGIALWGISSTRRLDTIYDTISANDLVMFVQESKVISIGMVLMKIESSILSEKCWGSSDWSNIIFLTEVKDLSAETKQIELREIWEILGYSERYILRGALVVKSEKSNSILEKYEHVNTYLTYWTDKSKKERRKENTSSNIANFNPKIFISYAHADEYYKVALIKHLHILLKYWKAGEIWDDRKLEAGVDYNEQISKHIDEANIYILLISSDYFYSNYCMKEFDMIMEKDKIIIPIIVRSCYWKKLFSNDRKALITFPQNNSNIFTSEDQDEEFTKIVEHIDKEISSRLK